MWDVGNMMGERAMFGLWHLLWWPLLIVGIVVLVRWGLSGGGADRRGGENRALEIVKERYARGEIDKTGFEARKRDLA